MKPINLETDQRDLVEWLSEQPPAANTVVQLPPHVLKPTNTIIKHTPSHVDYTTPGHAYPMRHFITGPFAGTGIEMSPAIIERNEAVLEGLA